MVLFFFSERDPVNSYAHIVFVHHVCLCFEHMWDPTKSRGSTGAMSGVVGANRKMFDIFAQKIPLLGL